MRKIKLIKINNEDFIYINRGVNNFLFSQEELAYARYRFKQNKNLILSQLE